MPCTGKSAVAIGWKSGDSVIWPVISFFVLMRPYNARKQKRDLLHHLLVFFRPNGRSRSTHTGTFAVNFAGVSFCLVLAGTVVAMWGRTFLEAALISVLGSMILTIASTIVAYIIVAPIWWADALDGANR